MLLFLIGIFVAIFYNLDRLVNEFEFFSIFPVILSVYSLTKIDFLEENTFRDIKRDVKVTFFSFNIFKKLWK